MNLKVIVFVCALFAAAFADENTENKVEKADENSEEFAEILTDETFDITIKKNNYFVKFYAPWCHHCVALAPAWNQLAELLNTQDESRVKIAKVDCTENQITCTENEITSYPTLKFFKTNGEEPIKYRSTRDLPSLTQFINDQLGSTQPDDSENEISEEQAVPSALKGLIELNEKNFNELTATGNWFVKFFAPWCGHCQKLAPIWTDLATALEHDNTVNVAKIDCTEFRPICKDFEVKGYPTLLWLENGKKVDKYSGPRTVEDLKAYVDKRSNAKSEEKVEVEKKEGEGAAVLVLSGDSFDQAIEKDITFVKFYAPWCGHCKRLAPAWQQLAEKFVGDETIKIAKVDCTLSESRDLCSQQDVNGFPTIFIYKNGEKISEYNGSRNLDDLYEFVKSHAADKPRDEL